MVIEVGSIDFSRGDFRLTAGNFSVQKGEKVAILGENGSGKSTLMLLMTGLLGEADIKYMGSNISSTSYGERARILSFLPQMPDVSLPFTASEVAGFGSMDRDAAEAGLRLADVFHLRDRVFSELSGGEKRRVMLARVLNQNTPVQLMDEPVSMLDIRHKLEILKLLTESDKTFVASIHDVNMALSHFDRFIFLKDGDLKYDLKRNQVSGHIIEEVFDVKVSGDSGRFNFQI